MPAYTDRWGGPGLDTAPWQRSYRRESGLVRMWVSKRASGARFVYRDLQRYTFMTLYAGQSAFSDHKSLHPFPPTSTGDVEGLLRVRNHHWRVTARPSSPMVRKLEIESGLEQLAKNASPTGRGNLRIRSHGPRARSNRDYDCMRTSLLGERQASDSLWR